MTTNTTSIKKITKRDRYNELLAIEAVNTNPDLVAFIENELNLLAKKNSADKKPTATQVANEEIKNAILAYMKPDEKYTVTDFIKSVPECADKSNQKISAMMIQLIEENKVQKIIEKRVSYFALA